MACLAAWASGRPSRVVFSSATGLIITVADGEGGVIEREAGLKQGARQGHAHALSRMMVVDRSTAASADLDGADLIRRC